MKSSSLSLTSMACPIGPSPTGPCTLGRFLQKARRNGAAAILSNRINNLAPRCCTVFRTETVQIHTETVQIHTEIALLISYPSVRNAGQRLADSVFSGTRTTTSLPVFTSSCENESAPTSISV